MGRGAGHGDAAARRRVIITSQDEIRVRIREFESEPGLNWEKGAGAIDSLTLEHLTREDSELCRVLIDQEPSGLEHVQVLDLDVPQDPEVGERYLQATKELLLEDLDALREAIDSETGEPGLTTYEVKGTTLVVAYGDGDGAMPATIERLEAAGVLKAAGFSD